MKQKTIMFYRAEDKPVPELSEDHSTIRCSSPGAAIDLLIRLNYHIDCIFPSLYREGRIIELATIVVSYKELPDPSDQIPERGGR